MRCVFFVNVFVLCILFFAFMIWPSMVHNLQVLDIGTDPSIGTDIGTDKRRAIRWPMTLCFLNTLKSLFGWVRLQLLAGLLQWLL